jgi:ACS family D-galactonate transporter-like MFS transporter
VAITVSFASTGPAANATLTSDLLRSPADAGRAFAFLVLGGNVFGLFAPIVTGYLVEATGNFSSAFIAAGVLALIGTAATLLLSRGAIGDVPAISGRPALDTAR